MKNKAKFLALTLFIGILGLHAQQRVTVKATSYDISDNLDLEAVASMFGDASNLEDFERNLNDPEVQISNLDLNEDGYVDYLRVVESLEEGTHLILVQAVLAKDIYQDVATIDVEKRGNDVVVQVVGNSYIYGTNYIIEPVYVSRPVIYSYFWGPRYVRWVSPYYYGYYPVYYNRWAPRPVFVYHRHVHRHIRTHHTYRHVAVRKSARAYQMYQRQGRNDYARTNPNRSFERRNAGVQNREQLTASRTTVNRRPQTVETRPAQAQRSSTTNQGRSTSVRTTQNRSTPANRPAVSTSRTQVTGRNQSTSARQSSTVRSTPGRSASTARQQTATTRNSSTSTRSTVRSAPAQSTSNRANSSRSTATQRSTSQKTRSSSPHSSRASTPSRSSTPSRATPSTNTSSAPARF